jgi:ComF family protein
MADSGPRNLVQTALTSARPLARWALDLIVPPACPVCRAPLGRQDGLCAECWGRLSLISPPFCSACGSPFELSIGAAQLCAPCIAQPPSVFPVRAAAIYDDGSKALILPLKHADRLDLAPLMARLMRAAGREALEGADYVVPVPSHWTRLVWRRANQAAELARALARFSGVDYAPGVLTRMKRTPLQGTYGGVAGRAQNVRGAFAVPVAERSKIQGKRVVVVDDVWTTGATVNACGRVLRAAGAAQVSAVTFARVVRPAALGL